VLREAVELGRLAPSALRGMLPPHEWPQPSQPALPEGAHQAKALVEDLTRKLASEQRKPKDGT
jgi:hypothetical protein